MDRSTTSANVKCYIVVPPHYRPQLATGVNHESGVNLKAAVQYTSRVNENRIPLASGRMDVFQLGSVRKDIVLDITGAGPETELVLDEIIERNIPVYIYPRAGAGLQLSLPLRKGIGTDPLNSPTVTHTLTVSSGTTIYQPRADAGHGIYLEAVDTSLPLVDGVWSGNCEAGQLPTGRGYPFWKKRTNCILNSLISGINNAAPYAPGSEWGAYTSAADVWGTDHGIKSSPFCADANAYWTTSTTTHLRSFTFALPGGTDKSLSFCYRVAGIMSVVLKDSGGALGCIVNITSGSGRAMVDLDGLASSYSDAYLQVQLLSGSYCEFSCPQLIDDNMLDSSEYHPFLGTTSAATEAKITACSLKVEDIDLGADSVAFSTTGSDRDGVLLFSGYCQPMFDVDYTVSSNLNTVIQPFGYDNSLKLNIGYDGSSGLEWTLYIGASEVADAAVSGHVQGDVYAFGLWSGYNNGTAETSMKVVRLRDGARYFGSSAESMITCHTLWIGSDAGTAQSDCVMSAITAEATTAAEADIAINRLADDAVRNVFRNSWGRWYRLEKATSPRANGEAHLSTGQYIGTEVRAI